MTMPNPVAEVVERLRSIGGPTREEAADLIEHQQAEIERLSRERDTGVPEELLNTVAEWAKWARTWSGSAFLSGDPVENDEENRGALYTDLCKLGNHMIWLEDELLKLRSAAPQPPTASEGWQDISTAPRDGRWFLICREDEGPESYEVGCFDPQTWSAYEPAENGLYRKVERVVNEWRGFNNFHRATHWTALLGHPGDPDLSTLTRERDQAREALAPFAKVLDAMEHDNQLCEEEIDSVLAGTGIVPSDLRRARSVLHPEKEDHS